jgi:hemoglobin
MNRIVSRESIAEVVDAFYVKARRDPLLGPVFAGVIGDDWGRHLSKMREFWASVLLASRSYKGNPMLAHLQLTRLTATHFERWLFLWRETTSELCSDELASLFVRKAEMIGSRLLYAITSYHGSLASNCGEEVPRAV